MFADLERFCLVPDRIFDFSAIFYTIKFVNKAQNVNKKLFVASQTERINGDRGRCEMCYFFQRVGGVAAIVEQTPSPTQRFYIACTILDRTQGGKSYLQAIIKTNLFDGGKNSE